ncbi:hypothetical protein [Psychrobacillus psychrodurans]|uniref:hypothetical protein n=1 Tax=Psychrobacillus psychrodurans TaxID=126157 RepID=UPI0008E38C50|nr:hypothetical protein [Psychrobacillus psychrodurans]MCZ8541968.1 hypothetical protein [Psychrobacillus psychrodurans]SFN13953.1 hypothetical protein SAMN05421832_11648 [Psychrobacillus psychrodurans]
MGKFNILKRFRDREGKELKGLTSKQVLALKVYEAGKVYESDNKEWTEYLVKEGFLKSTGTKTTTVKKEEKAKRQPSKKESE